MSETLIETALKSVLQAMGVEEPRVHLERPRDPTHGDWATNVALTLAKELRRPPREIAQEIVDRLDLAEAGADRIEVAGPGFLNFHLSSGAIAGVLGRILSEDGAYGRGDVG